MCKLCGDEFESVVHVLWECPVYAAIRNTFMEILDSCGAVLKSIVHSRVLIWDNWKNKLYGDQDGETSVCSCSCPLTGDHTTAYGGACGTSMAQVL